MIKYIDHFNIDREKWDTCVMYSSIPVIYAQSWYLDVVCEKWDALVLNDYEAVMIISRKKKWGINYIYKPYFTQQVGIFSLKHNENELLPEFLKTIPANYKKIHLLLNITVHPEVKKYSFTKRINHILDTKDNYEVIAGRYARRCKRNLKTAHNAGLELRNETSIPDTIRFLEKYLGAQITELNTYVLNILEKIISVTLNNKTGNILSLYNKEQEKVATLFYAANEKRCTLLVCASSPEGLKYQAMYLLIDSVIRLYAGTGTTIDFFGSSIESIAYFNLSFGTTATEYYLVSSKSLFGLL